jgi:hypothetical protein
MCPPVSSGAMETVTPGVKPSSLPCFSSKGGMSSYDADVMTFPASSPEILVKLPDPSPRLLTRKSDIRFIHYQTFQMRTIAVDCGGIPLRHEEKLAARRACSRRDIVGSTPIRSPSLYRLAKETWYRTTTDARQQAALRLNSALFVSDCTRRKR